MRFKPQHDVEVSFREADISSSGSRIIFDGPIESVVWGSNLYVAEINLVDDTWRLKAYQKDHEAAIIFLSCHISAINHPDFVHAKRQLARQLNRYSEQLVSGKQPEDLQFRRALLRLDFAHDLPLLGQHLQVIRHQVESLTCLDDYYTPQPAH